MPHIIWRRKMTNHTNGSLKRKARIAGAWYLSMVVAGPFYLMYVPGKLIVHGDAAATAENIRAHELLFRVAILSEVVGAILFMFLGLALYRLFSSVDKAHAAQMLAMVLISAAVGFVDTLNSIATLVLARGGEFLSIFDRRQLDAMAMFFLRLHFQGNLINEIFWGLWLLPFGWLVIKSGFLPKFIGAWLLVNGVAYVAISLIGLFRPESYDLAFKSAFPVLCGELAIMLWLLIKGAK